MINERGTVFVDNTTLSSVARCDAQAALRHVLGYTVVDEDAHALECGSAAHELFAAHLAGKSATYCLNLYEHLYKPYSDTHGLDELRQWGEWGGAGKPHRLSYVNTSMILDEWLATHPVSEFSFAARPGLIEVGFATPLSDECVCGHPKSVHETGMCWGEHPQRTCACSTAEFAPAFVLTGRYDAIVQSKNDGALYVLDHKTTGRLTPYWTAKFRNDSQMSGYVWAAQQTIGQRVAGVYINAVEFSSLPNSTRKCAKHGAPFEECGRHHMNSQLLVYTRTPEQLDEWRASAIELARKYRELLRSHARGEDVLTNTRTRGTFHNACGFCSFNEFCAAGRPKHYVSTMLTYKPWRPFEMEEPKNVTPVLD